MTIQILKDCSQGGRAFTKGPKPIEVEDSVGAFLVAIGNAKDVTEKKKADNA